MRLLVLYICLGVWSCEALVHIDGKHVRDHERNQDVEASARKGDHGLLMKPTKARSRRRRDIGSQLPSDFDSNPHYTPLYTGQCFMCPPGPRGPPGVDGRDGRDGRDQNLASTPSDSSTEPPSTTTISPGKTYIRWGLTTCPEGTQLVYAGVVGGKHYTQKGSGTNYLCLHSSPVFDNPVTGRQGGALIYGTETETAFGQTIPNLAQESEIACAVCMASSKHDVLMIPGVNNCPTEQGWHEEYHGYLGAMHYIYHATKFICLDHQAEGIPRTGHDNDPSLLYRVEAACSGSGGGLPCPPYVDGYEVTCAVCSI